MTAHVHDPATHGGGMRPEATPADGAATASSRPRWLVPGLLVATIFGGLVVAGVLSFSTVLYAGLFGGMILIHAGGHGHGGRGGRVGGDAGRGHELHGDGGDDADDLSRRSSGAQSPDSGSATGLEQRAPSNAATSETHDHDQHRSHGCH
jgi:hypothetical protein